MSSKPVINNTKDNFAESLNQRIVSLDGQLDLRRAERVRADLMAAIDSGEPVRIELADATGADIAFVQLLLAAVRAAARRGRPLQIGGLSCSPIPPLLAALGLPRPDPIRRRGRAIFHPIRDPEAPA